MPVLSGTSLCRNKWELLPFVRRIETQSPSTMQFVWFCAHACVPETSTGGAIIRHPVVLHLMAGIHITDIEAAINHWRDRRPSPDGITLSPQVRVLAEVYALMVFDRKSEVDESALPDPAMAAWLGWYESTPDTPCIAICSTSQGDEECKGCGRSFDEVQRWTEMRPAEKRQTWRRITLSAQAWRFNRYAERAGGDETMAPERLVSAGA